MKDWWLKFGCFLSGYNYKLLSDCSEVSKKFVKKITSALVIVSIIWAFIGFLFSTRYLQLPLYGAIIGAVIMLIIIVQIERQIILSIKPGVKLMLLRAILGIIIAIIGSTIIDQVFFKNDISIKRNDLITERIKVRTQNETEAKDAVMKQLNDQISDANTHITNLSRDIAKEGATISSGSSRQTIASKKDSSVTTNVQVNRILNPKIEERDTYLKLKTDDNNKILETQKDYLAKITAIKNSALSENSGFLDELAIMFQLLKDSTIAMVVYLLWFGFFFLIELFILFTKFGEHPTDYDQIILYQMSIREKRLADLENRNNMNLGEDVNIAQTRSLVNKYNQM